MGKGKDPAERVILTASLPPKAPEELLEVLRKFEVPVMATIRQEMPVEVVDVLRKHDLKIKLDKIVASKLFDQMPGMASKDGCWSAPSGPGC